MRGWQRGTTKYESLRKLQAVTDAALAHLSLDELLDALLERIRDALDADTAAILLLDTETNELVARAAKGLEEEVEQGVRIPVGLGFAGRVAAALEPIAIEDVDHADIFNPILREKGIKSLLGAPLVVRGEVIGVVHVGTLKPRRFNRDDVSLLQLVADRAALAIDHSRLFEAERVARERAEASAGRLRALQDVTDLALARLSTDDLFGELLERVRDALSADTCAILLLDPDRKELVARAAVGIEEEVERGVRLPVGRGFAGRVAATRRPVVLDDVDHADVLNPILREKGIKSLLGVPLVTRGRVLGVIHVGTLVYRRFSPGDVELLELVAERIALALERALIHDELLQLDAMKRDFVVTAAHELRTPTSVIYGVAKTLKERRDSLDAETFAALLEALHDGSVRLARLIEDLLDFSRLDSKQGGIPVEPLSMAALIDDVMRGLSMVHSEKVDVLVPADMIVVADRNALERILSNLIKNALVHGAPPISLKASTSNGEVRISIADRGPGISVDFIGRLFEPFARSDEAGGRPGVGLGLSIAHSYARELGGDLLYEQAEPGGARFTLVLPQPPSEAA
jgi:signal transduction histidine kinase